MTSIQGFADPAATGGRAGRFATVQYGELGRTGLRCSQAGFGCYRVAAGVPEHREAMAMALDGGINLIDTSTNYADGESEVLVGKVLTDKIRAGVLRREEVIVVSKAGYLQGRNYALSQDRRARQRPFPELVPYAEGLEHCIHPDFLEDQLSRSLERLNLATLDVYLLHNPEYYLNWAARQGRDLQAAAAEYDRRIREAFRFLEEEADRGRIRHYGISSNTFPVDSARRDFTCLARVLAIAEEVRPANRFAVIQFPMNLVENGAVRLANQPDGATLLAAARRARLGTLVNRPLNAIGPQGLLRLADVETPPARSAAEVDKALRALLASEDALVRDVLPDRETSPEIRTRIVAQVRIAAALLQQYREIASYDAWCRIRDTHLHPRVHGVLAHFERRPGSDPLRQWAATHRRRLTDALESVTSCYAAPAAARAELLRSIVREADPDWLEDGSLSQLVLRALRTTSGISAVLVGMRRPRYVRDVLEELTRSKTAGPRARAWQHIERRLGQSGLSQPSS